MATVSVRRLAMGKLIPEALDHMVKEPFEVPLLPQVVESAKVCLSCKDNSKCAACVFGSLGDKQDTAALTVAL